MNNRGNNRRPQQRRSRIKNSQNVGRGNTSTTTRTFTTNQVLELNNSNGSNTVGNHRMQWDAAEFEGFDHVASTYDQYRCIKLEVFVTPTMGNPNWAAPSTPNQTLSNLAKVMAKFPLNCGPSTTVYSAVDYNYDLSPGIDIFSFNNLRNHTLDPFRPVKIADFQPQLSIDATTTSGGSYSGELNLSKDTWLNTKSTQFVFHGLVIRLVNSNALAAFADISTEDDFQRVNFRTVATFIFKGPNYKAGVALQGTTTSLPDVPLLLLARR